MFTSHLFATDGDPFVVEMTLDNAPVQLVDQHTRLRIATTSNIEPYVGTDPQGKPNGLLVDIWNLWSEKTGIEIVFIIGDTSSSLDFIHKGKADIHIGYPESETLKSGLLRSQRIYQIKSRLFHFGEPAPSLSNLSLTRIGALATAPYLDKVKRSLPDAEVKLYGSVAAMIDAATAGYIASFIAASASTQHYLIEKEVVSDFTPLVGLTFITDLFVLCPQGNSDLLTQIKEGFALISEEELTAIEQKWIVDADNWTQTNKMKMRGISASERAFLNTFSPLKVGYINKKTIKNIDNTDNFMEVKSHITQQIQEQLGVSIEPIEYQQGSALMADLTHGRITLAVDLSHMVAASKSVRLSDPYWPLSWVVLTSRESMSIANIEQLRGQSIAMVDNDLSVTELLEVKYNIELIPVANTKAGIKAVTDGLARAFMIKATDVSALLTQSEAHRLQMTLLADIDELKSHIGVHADSARFVPLINKVLSDIKQKTRQAIYHYGVSSNIKKPLEWISLLAGLFIVLFIALFILIKWILSQELIKRKQLESKFQQLSNYDTLTALPNRSLLDDRLEQAVLFHCRELTSFAVLFVEFGGIKAINTDLGYKAGDQLIKTLSDVLRHSVRRSDTVARFSSDEFVVILNRTKDLDIVCQVAETIISHLSEDFEVEQTSVNVVTSIGVAMYPADGDIAVELLRTADELMSRAKKLGGNCYKSR